MLRHVVLLRFTEGAADDTPLPDHLDEVERELLALVGRVPSIRSYRVDRDLQLAEDNAHLAVTADFDDAAGHAAYRDHPDHVSVIDRLIRPRLDWRSATQFEV